MSLNGLPAIVSRQSVALQDRYMSGNSQRRLELICDFAQRTTMTTGDWLALAVLEVRHSYNDRLPPGLYRNLQNHTFKVLANGNMSGITTRVPADGRSWVPIHRREVHSSVPLEMHFHLGVWHPAPLAHASRHQNLALAQHGQYSVPAELQGATFCGILSCSSSTQPSNPHDLPHNDQDPFVTATPSLQLSVDATAERQPPYISPSAAQEPLGAASAIGQSIDEATAIDGETPDEWGRRVMLPVLARWREHTAGDT